MFQLECFLIFKHIWDDDPQVYILQGADSPGRSESLVLTNRHCAASQLEPMMMGKKAGEKLKKQTLQSRTWLENLLCRIWVDDAASFAQEDEAQTATQSTVKKAGKMAS